MNAEDFFVDLFTTDLRSGELVTRIEIPSQRGRRSAYVKMAHPASRYAVVGVCVVLEMDGSLCTGARVAVGGAVPKATRSAGAESVLEGKAIDDAVLDAAASALVNDIAASVIGDMYAPEEYRKAMAGVYLKRAVRLAIS